MYKRKLLQTRYAMESTAQVKRRFGAWIKQKREEGRLSQGGAAGRAGIDRQQWYRIESGLSGTKRDTVIAMANALTVSVSEALQMAGFAAETEDNEEGLFSGLNELSPEKQKLAKKMIRSVIDSLAEKEEHDET